MKHRTYTPDGEGITVDESKNLAATCSGDMSSSLERCFACLRPSPGYKPNWILDLDSQNSARGEFVNDGSDEAMGIVDSSGDSDTLILDVDQRASGSHAINADIRMDNTDEQVSVGKPSVRVEIYQSKLISSWNLTTLNRE